ncbi:unnamed protein product [Rotaria sordida]|uniref:Uncharacterized protein n=1 Tax=Rotaria sordida TaxID=392033 RepID=A0A819TYA9_9BILA|nr:unnamed protein product [Rotaria sordida]
MYLYGIFFNTPDQFSMNLSYGNDNKDYEHSYQEKWCIVSPRKILPMILLNKSLLSTIDSVINIDLLRTTAVGSTILHFGINNRFNITQ